METLNELVGRYPALKNCSGDIERAREILIETFAVGNKLMKRRKRGGLGPHRRRAVEGISKKASHSGERPRKAERIIPRRVGEAR